MGKTEAKHFCIDEYEYPNKKGSTPAVMVSWYEAKAACESRGERLCGDDEWTLACEGPQRLPYPYGWKRDAEACNIDKTLAQARRRHSDGVERPARRGQGRSRGRATLAARTLRARAPACVSPYGVYDMGGNVDEWTENVTLGGRPYRSLFKGGHWAKGARNRCRPTTESHNESTVYYAEGFRCCSDWASRR